jgi:hypothetical protein
VIQSHNNNQQLELMLPDSEHELSLDMLCNIGVYDYIPIYAITNKVKSMVDC